MLLSNDILHLHSSLPPTPVANSSSSNGPNGSNACLKSPEAPSSVSIGASAAEEVHPLPSAPIGAPGTVTSTHPRLLFHLQVESQAAELTCREERGSPLAALLLKGVCLNVKVGEGDGAWLKGEHVLWMLLSP